MFHTAFLFLSVLGESFRERFAFWVEEEKSAQFLLNWFVVFFAIGVMLFFSSDGSAGPIPVLFGITAATAFLWKYRHHTGKFSIALIIIALFAGFGSGVFRMQRVSFPVLQETVIGDLKGRIEKVEPRTGRTTQLTIWPETISGLENGKLPDRIRVGVRMGRDFNAGDAISAKIRLLPLPQPVRPHGYDFARDAYFRGLGGVGSVLGKAETTMAASSGPWELELNARIDRARNALTERIYRAIGGEAGGVAAALVTGKRGYIPEETNDVLRAAGIYHVVSISGLHMVIAAGMVFWFVRAVLALFPEAALHWQLKKIAAAISMLAATGYCLFSGAEVATQRSLIMTLIMLGAILFDRKALSMRNLAIAALIILLLTPEALLSPGFQMSFAAVAGLITLAGNMKLYGLGDTGSHGGWVIRILRYIVGWVIALVGTTLVAGLATAPYAAYHFQTASPYGLIGNSLALPLISVVVMPAGALGILSLPFGLDGPVWQIMGEAISFSLDVSRRVADLHGSILYFPAFATSGLLLVSTGLVIATLLTTPLRYLAVLPLVFGLTLSSHPERYVAFIDRDGRAAAIRGEDGKLQIVGAANAFLIEQWLRADGDGRSQGDETLKVTTGCDSNGCAGQGVITVAISKSAVGLREDCQRADIVVSRYEIPEWCQAPIRIDGKQLGKYGAMAVTRQSGHELMLEYSRNPYESWPWQISR